MTTPIQSPHEAVGNALAAFMRIEWFMLLVWAMTLVYMILQDRSDRQYAMDRHQEVMESIRGVPTSVIQQVRIEQKYGRFDMMLKDKQDGN